MFDTWITQHAEDLQPETDSNFGAVFPVWDILLGTFRTSTREPQRSMQLGLEEVRDRRVDAIGWLMASPFLELATGDIDPQAGCPAVTSHSVRKEH